jgi:hypothetical protein
VLRAYVIIMHVVLYVSPGGDIALAQFSYPALD